MKPALEKKERQVRHQRIEAAVGGRMAALFDSIPELCGFSIGADLQPREVAVHGWPGLIASEALYRDIIETVTDLVEERAEAAEVLRGRTFARAIQ